MLPGDRAALGPLEVDLGDAVVLEHGDALLADVDRDEQLALRGRERGAAWAAGGGGSAARADAATGAARTPALGVRRSAGLRSGVGFSPAARLGAAPSSRRRASCGRGRRGFRGGAWLLLLRLSARPRLWRRGAWVTAATGWCGSRVRAALRRPLLGRLLPSKPRRGNENSFMSARAADVRSAAGRRARCWLWVKARGHRPRRKASRSAVRRRSYDPANRRLRGCDADETRGAKSCCLIEEADAWFEYLEATRGQTAIRYREVEPWAWAVAARIAQRQAAPQSNAAARSRATAPASARAIALALGELAGDWTARGLDRVARSRCRRGVASLGSRHRSRASAPARLRAATPAATGSSACGDARITSRPESAPRRRAPPPRRARACRRRRRRPSPPSRRPGRGRAASGRRRGSRSPAPTTPSTSGSRVRSISNPYAAAIRSTRRIWLSVSTGRSAPGTNTAAPIERVLARERPDRARRRPRPRSTGRRAASGAPRSPSASRERARDLVDGKPVPGSTTDDVLARGRTGSCRRRPRPRRTHDRDAGALGRAAARARRPRSARAAEDVDERGALPRGAAHAHGRGVAAARRAPCAQLRQRARRRRRAAAGPRSPARSRRAPRAIDDGPERQLLRAAGHRRAPRPRAWIAEQHADRGEVRDHRRAADARRTAAGCR